LSRSRNVTTTTGHTLSSDVDIANRDLLRDDAQERHELHEQDEARRARDERAFDFHPDPRPARRVKRSNTPRPDRLWRERVLERDQGCCIHTNPADCSDSWQAHHVVPQQELRRTFPEALWNPASGMGVCGLAHRQHHNRVRPIELDEIPLTVRDYLQGCGYGPFIERHYPASGATESDGKA
jgi:hypothetical protein